MFDKIEQMCDYHRISFTNGFDIEFVHRLCIGCTCERESALEAFQIKFYQIENT